MRAGGRETRGQARARQASTSTRKSQIAGRYGVADSIPTVAVFLERRGRHGLLSAPIPRPTIGKFFDELLEKEQPAAAA